MSAKPDTKIPEPKMDTANLYREDVFTDRKVGTIRQLVPVKTDGSPDGTRKIVFVGEAQLMTTVGALPLNFEIDASSLTDAIAKYGPAVKQAFEHAMEEIQEMRRQQSSSIVIPERGGFGGPGGLPGGGKLKLP